MIDINLRKLEEAARAAVVRGGIAGIEELLANAKSALPAQASAATRQPRKSASTPVTSANPAPAKKSAGPKKGAPREAKRTPAEMAQQAERVLNVVKANGPMNMEGLAKATGLSSKTLVLPVKALLKEGKVKSEGQKRATTYKLAA